MRLEALAELEAAYMAFNARRSLRHGEPRFAVERIAGALLLTDTARLELSAYNRALGVTTVAQLEACAARLRELGAEPRVDLDEAGASDELRAHLAGHGLAPQARIVYLVHGGEPPAAPALEVREPAHAELPTFFDLLERSIGPIDAGLRALRGEHYATGRFPVDLALVDGEPIAWATSFFAEGGVMLGNAYTLPEHRGRGAQSALLAARLRRATARGAGPVVTDVEPDTTSLRNALRAGFGVLTTREVWMRAAGEVF